LTIKPLINHYQIRPDLLPVASNLIKFNLFKKSFCIFKAIT